MGRIIAPSRRLSRLFSRPPSPASGLVVMALLAGWAGACGLGGKTIEQVDSEAIPDKVNYTRDIKPRMEYYCLGCHNTGSQLGTAGGWDFSTYELVRASFESIKFHSFDAKDMPPGGARRMDAYDYLVFIRWQRLGYPECETNAHCTAKQRCVKGRCAAR